MPAGLLSLLELTMSYTLWVYDHETAQHHDNDLVEDTFAQINEAITTARMRVANTNHETGWARIIDNFLVGHLGDRGIVAVFRKNAVGHVRMTYQHESLMLGPAAHMQHCRENQVRPFLDGR
jgi:hypothetical protein